MCNQCFRNRSNCTNNGSRSGCMGCLGGCPFADFRNVNRLCSCASGVVADLISSCDAFCSANAGRNSSCGCRNRCCN